MQYVIGLLIRHGDASLELVAALRWLLLSGVYTSPNEGAFETAQPLADDHSLDVRVRPALADDRIVNELLTLARSHPGETVAIVTHAEPIRCALAAFSGRSLDEVRAIEILPACVTAIGVGPAGVRSVLGVNLPASEVAV